MENSKRLVPEAGIRGNEAKTERRTGQETELNLQWRYGL